MGFLNLRSWGSVGGRQEAERRSTMIQAQPARYYYENLRDFQAIVDQFFETNGRRPNDLLELYLWRLDQQKLLDDDTGAADLADWLSYYDIERNSLLGMVSVEQDRASRSRKLLDARHVKRVQRDATKRRSAKATAGATAG